MDNCIDCVYKSNSNDNNDTVNTNNNDNESHVEQGRKNSKVLTEIKQAKILK